MIKKGKYILWILIFSVIIVTHLNGIYAEEKEKKAPYLTLLSEKNDIPYGHVIIRIPKEKHDLLFMQGKIPEDWKMEWFVSLYNPKGYRLYMGLIEDKIPLDMTDSQLILKVPVGEYNFEITRNSISSENNPDLTGLTRGNWSGREWIPNKNEPIKVGNVKISITAGDVKIIDIYYENPQVSTSSMDNVNITKKLYTFENLKLLEKRAKKGEIRLPSYKPKRYPLIYYASFKDITELHLIEALKVKDRKGKDQFSSSKYIRQVAVESLLKRDNLKNISSIIAILHDDPLSLNWEIAQILAKWGDGKVVESLIAALKSKAKITDLNSESKAARWQAKSDSEAIRWQAAWALGEMKDRRAVQSLIAATKEDESARVRCESIWALAKIKDNRAVESLINAIEDKDSFIGKGSILQIPISKKTETSQYWKFINMFSGSVTIFVDSKIPSYSVRENAIYALGQIPDSRAVKPLIDTLKNKDTTRFFALFALGEIGDKRAIESLLFILKTDKGEAFRAAAAKALGKIGDQQAIQLLTESSKNDSESIVREAATDALKIINR